MVEIIGTIASVLAATSFFMNGEKRIRTVNMIASIVFIVYALCLGSISLIFLNSISIVVNAVKIYKIKKEK